MLRHILRGPFGFTLLSPVDGDQMLLFASVHAEYNLCNPYLHLGQIVAELGRKFVVDAVPGASLWIPV